MARNAGRQKTIMIILLLLLFGGMINCMQQPHHFHNPTADAIALTVHELDQKVTDTAIDNPAAPVQRVRPAWNVRIPRPNYRRTIVIPFFCFIAGGIGILIWELCF